MPVPPSQQAWRASWSPSVVQLEPPLGAHGSATTDKDFGDLPLADDSPLSYFLSPTVLSEEDEADYFMDDYDGDESDDFTEFELDAGIEDASHPLPIVRSVSPSSLIDLGLPRPRPPTPPRSHLASRERAAAAAAAATGEQGQHINGDVENNVSDEYDDEPVFSFQLDAHDEMVTPSPAILDMDADDDSDSWTPSTRTRFLFPTAALHYLPALVDPPATASRGRPTSRRGLPASDAGSGTAPASASASGSRQGIPITGRRPPRAPRSPRSPRSWRMPSPDVFSIEEETEQQLVDSGLLDYAVHLPVGTIGSVTIKPKKHVRFVLPDEEVV